MSASRSGVTGACWSARFWFSAVCAALMPTPIGYQDIAALIARERAQPSHWHLIVSPVQAATFSYSRPIGSAIPQPLGFQNVNFDPHSLDAFSWNVDEPLHARPGRQIEYRTGERRHKADRLRASVLPAKVLPAPAAMSAIPASRAAPARAQVEHSAPAHVEEGNTALLSPGTPDVSAIDAHQEQARLAPAGGADAAAPGEVLSAAPQPLQPQVQPAPSVAEAAPPQTKMPLA